jgi:hypothetical protein
MLGGAYGEKADRAEAQTVTDFEPNAVVSAATAERMCF